MVLTEAEAAKGRGSIRTVSTIASGEWGQTKERVEIEFGRIEPDGTIYWCRIVTNAPPTGEIVRNPRICGGAPIIAGTRTGVHHVVSYARAYQQDLARVRTEALPHLSMEQIQAALFWYSQHPGEIDTLLDHDREAYERIRAGRSATR